MKREDWIVLATILGIMVVIFVVGMFSAWILT